MAKLTINVGATANDRQGDSLRGAFQKINANFSELYTALGLSDDTTLNLGAFEFTGSTMSTTDSSAITIDQAVTVSSNLTVGGDIVPSSDLGANLGSSTNRFKDLFLSGNTITLGNQTISATSTGISTSGTITATSVNVSGSLSNNGQPIETPGIVPPSSAPVQLAISNPFNVGSTGIAIDAENDIVIHATGTGSDVALLADEISIAAPTIGIGQVGATTTFNGSVDFTAATTTGVSVTETDPVVGAINGIVKADGAGNISQAVAGTDYLALDGGALDIQEIDNAKGAASGSALEILTFNAFDINIKTNQFSSDNAFRIDVNTGTDIRHTESSPRIQTQSYGTEFLNGVIKIPVLSSAPSSPADGMIAIADGSGWNPLSNGLQSMVVYLNGGWREIGTE